MNRFTGMAKRVQAYELGTLLTLLFLASGLWIFAELVDEVLEGETHAFDNRVLLALRSSGDPTDPLGDEWVEELGRDFTALGGVAILTTITLAVVGYLVIVCRARMALFLATTVASGITAGFLLKNVFDRPRPDLVPHGSYVYTSSFPSGHSMMSALTYLTLAVLLARVHEQRRAKLYLVGVATFLTLAVGISRVYLGVHWPTDVLAGWIVGAVWAIGCWLVARLLQRRGEIEPEGDLPPAVRRPLNTP